MKKLMAAAALTAMALFNPAMAAEAGKHYQELRAPVPTAEPGKIEVVELFWFGCPHCYDLEPTIEPWVEQLPEDVNFVRVPAMFGGAWNTHGQLYLTLEAMGKAKELTPVVFKAYHQDGNKLADVEAMADLLAEHGVDRAEFSKTFNSFAVKSKVEKIKKLGMAYGATGVPSVIVNGKYRLDVGSAGGKQELLQVTDELIAKERAAQ